MSWHYRLCSKFTTEETFLISEELLTELIFIHIYKYRSKHTIDQAIACTQSQKTNGRVDIRIYKPL